METLLYIATILLVIILACGVVLVIAVTVATLRAIFDDDSRFKKRQREFDEQKKRVQKELDKRRQ
jgi:cell division protein FtsL